MDRVGLVLEIVSAIASFMIAVIFLYQDFAGRTII